MNKKFLKMFYESLTPSKKETNSPRENFEVKQSTKKILLKCEKCCHETVHTQANNLRALEDVLDLPNNLQFCSSQSERNESDHRLSDFNKIKTIYSEENMPLKYNYILNKFL